MTKSQQKEVKKVTRTAVEKKKAADLSVGDVVLEFVPVSILNADENGLSNAMALSAQVVILEAKPVFKTNKVVITFEPVNAGKDGKKAEPTASLVDSNLEVYVEVTVEEEEAQDGPANEEAV